MSHAKLPISAVVICFNESRKIADCLRSLEWAEDMVVVDSLSTDGTPDIARQFTPRVYSQSWLGHVKQKNYACSLAQHDWVLSVDADEEVTPELRDEIFRLFQRPEGLLNGYRVPRRTFYLGRWIDHCGWLDAPMRLFRRSKGCFAGSDPHDRVEVEGEAGRLQHFLHHFNYEDVFDHAATVNRYSSIVAKGYYESGQRFSLLKLLFRPPLKFLETYVWKLGFLDGLPGLIICVMYAYQVFLRYAKLWEMQTFGDKAGSGSAAPKDSPSGKPA